jgi:peroxiredoxin
MKILTKVVVLACIIFLPLVLFSQQKSPAQLGIEESSIPTGIAVGEYAPNFTGITEDGNEIELNRLLEKGPVILIFYRGYWCSKCSSYLTNYSDSLNLLQTLGAQIVAVTPEVSAGINKTKSKTGFETIVISDVGDRIMEKYKVAFNVTEAYQQKIIGYYQVDIAEANGQTTASLPVPATFIIDRINPNKKGGKIIWRQFDLNYGNRASVKEMLDQLPQ